MNPIEVYNKKRHDLYRAGVDCQGRHKIGILYQQVQFGQVLECEAGNVHTEQDDEGHPFQFLDCRQYRNGKIIGGRLAKPALRVVRCSTWSTKRFPSNDQFSLFGSWNMLLKDCRATGPVDESGSGLCIDLGCNNVRVEGGNYSGGIVICDGCHTLTGVTSDRLSVSNEWYTGKEVIEVRCKGCHFDSLYIRQSPNIRVWFDGRLYRAR